jgi:hypothetical protein
VYIFKVVNKNLNTMLALASVRRESGGAVVDGGATVADERWKWKHSHPAAPRGMITESSVILAYDPFAF